MASQCRDLRVCEWWVEQSEEANETRREHDNCFAGSSRPKWIESSSPNELLRLPLCTSRLPFDVFFCLPFQQFQTTLLCFYLVIVFWKNQSVPSSTVDLRGLTSGFFDQQLSSFSECSSCVS